MGTQLLGSSFADTRETAARKRPDINISAFQLFEENLYSIHAGEDQPIIFEKIIGYSAPIRLYIEAGVWVARRAFFNQGGTHFFHESPGSCDEVIPAMEQPPLIMAQLKPCGSADYEHGRRLTFTCELPYITQAGIQPLFISSKCV